LIRAQERHLLIGGSIVQVCLDDTFEVGRHQCRRLAGDRDGALLASRAAASPVRLTRDPYGDQWCVVLAAWPPDNNE
ncbi:MAG: hypothetical protein ACR2PK_05420, partial [Acidimicrobiales bacterium]